VEFIDRDGTVVRFETEVEVPVLGDVVRFTNSYRRADWEHAERSPSVLRFLAARWRRFWPRQVSSSKRSLAIGIGVRSSPRSLRSSPSLGDPDAMYSMSAGFTGAAMLRYGVAISLG
jgi:hypothetical protein